MQEGVTIGQTNFRSKKTKFSIKIDDRRRHVYIIGKTGTGKSTLEENMAIEDIRAGRGVGIVDPHGEFAERVLRSLTELSNERKNLAALMADARKPDEYRWIEECDAVIVDVAQPDQTQIALRNCVFLKKGGLLLISIKSQSIDVTKKPREIYEQEKLKVEQAGMKVLQLIDLEPYEDKHCMIVARKE